MRSADPEEHLVRLSDAVGLRNLPDDLLNDLPVLVDDPLNGLFDNSLDDFFNVLWDLGCDDFLYDLDLGDLDNPIFLDDADFPWSDLLVLGEVLCDSVCDEISELLLLELRFEGLVLDVVVF